MKILLLNPNYSKRYNWGHHLFKAAFQRHHDVIYYGPGYPEYDDKLQVPDIIKKLNNQFDLILTYEAKYSRFFKGLGKITTIPKVHIQIDYSDATANWKGFSRRSNVDKYFVANRYDLFFLTASSNVEAIKDRMNTDKVFMLPFSVEINKYKDRKLKRDIDVMATYSTKVEIYPNRKKIQQMLQKINVKSFTSRVVREGYIKTINRSKMFVISNNFNKRLSMKYTEAMACGTMVLADEPEDLALQGFEDGKHLVIYKSMEDLKTKIQHYLNNADKRLKIARAGMAFVRENHSCDARVKQFIKIVKRELGI